MNPTVIGLAAILMWSLLAVMTVATGTMPPFQLTAVTFAIGACIGPLMWIARGVDVRAFRLPRVAWLVGIGGLFGYHALYFISLRHAPPAEAGLINYLWPLLIVVFSAFLPGERLAEHHIIGALMGLAGTVVLFAGKGVSNFAWEHAPGFLAAFVAAFVWAGYSVLSRKLAHVPTDAVAGFCAVTSILSAICHVALEQTVWPVTPLQWAALVALGLGPVGLAFFAWDVGMKRGEIRVLGAASYATTMLSTGFLILAGFAEATTTLALATLLIGGGGVIAAKDMLLRRS